MILFFLYSLVPFIGKGMKKKTRSKNVQKPLLDLFLCNCDDAYSLDSALVLAGFSRFTLSKPFLLSFAMNSNQGINEFELTLKSFRHAFGMRGNPEPDLLGCFLSLHRSRKLAEGMAYLILAKSPPLSDVLIIQNSEMIGEHVLLEPPAVLLGQRAPEKFAAQGFRRQIRKHLFTPFPTCPNR
jgi:hypothetical protein